MTDLAQSREFTVQACLGRGGFGEVYRAEMSTTGGLRADVALKVLRQDVDPESQAVERLRDEGRLLARLDHPVILKVYDVTVLQGRVTLVTEYIDGQDLGECLTPEAAMPIRALLQVLAAVASALHDAYNAPGASGGRLELVHRDIKPANIRIGKHGQVKLLDFGIARSDAVAREAKTGTNMMVGSLPYMAPERFLTDRPHPASDVFALGACLYEGLTGRRLFGDMSPPLVMRMAIDEGHYRSFLQDRLRELPADVAPAVTQLCEQLLEWNPEARPGAAEVAGRCEDIADEVGGRSLKAWARSRDWSQATKVQGPLVGQVLSEATLHRPREPVQEIPPEETRWINSGSLTAETHEPPPASRRPALILAVVGGAGLLGLVAVVAVGGAGAWWGGLLSTGVDQEALPSEAPVGAPASSEDAAGDQPPPKTELADAPSQEGASDLIGEPSPAEPAHPGSATVPEEASAEPPAKSAPPVGSAADDARIKQPSTQDPIPSPPKPAPPIEPPTPAPTATGSVAVQGDQTIELRAGDATLPPGKVPAGTWQIWARFGRDLQHAGDVTVAAGQEVVLKCNPLFQACSVVE